MSQFDILVFFLFVHQMMVPEAFAIVLAPTDSSRCATLMQQFCSLLSWFLKSLFIQCACLSIWLTAHLLLFFISVKAIIMDWWPKVLFLYTTLKYCLLSLQQRFMSFPTSAVICHKTWMFLLLSFHVKQHSRYSWPLIYMQNLQDSGR